MLSSTPSVTTTPQIEIAPLTFVIPLSTSTPEATTTPIKVLVSKVAAKKGVSSTTLYNLASSESSLDSEAVGDGGCSVGLVQINLCAHPSIDKADALDPEYALNYAATQIAKGNSYAWTVCSCVKYARALIGNVPLQNASQFVPNTKLHVGALAVFKYSSGVSHVAVVTSVKESSFTVKEANYKPCLTSTRNVSTDDEALIGFWEA